MDTVHHVPLLGDRVGDHDGLWRHHAGDARGADGVHRCGIDGRRRLLALHGPRVLPHRPGGAPQLREENHTIRPHSTHGLIFMMQLASIL